VSVVAPPSAVLPPQLLERIGVVVNPHSKKNLTRPDRWQRLHDLVRGTGQVRVTHTLDDLYQAVADFVGRDYRYLVSDGGDGSLHWLVNQTREVLEHRRGRPSAESDHPDYPVIIPGNGGTIDSVARRAGIRGHADGIVKVLNHHLREGREIPLTMVESLFVQGVRTVDGVDRPFRLISFAAAVAGVAARFFHEYYKVPVRGPGRIARLIGKIAASISLRSPAISWFRVFPLEAYIYADEFVRPRRARVWLDGRALPQTRFNVINAGAFPINLGGVLRAFPTARDGRIHVTAGTMSRLEFVVYLPQILLGRQIDAPRLYDGPARSLRVVAPDGELLDPVFDGEIHRGVRELTITPGPLIPMARIRCTEPVRSPA